MAIVMHNLFSADKEVAQTTTMRVLTIGSINPLHVRAAHTAMHIALSEMWVPLLFNDVHVRMTEVLQQYNDMTGKVTDAAFKIYVDGNTSAAVYILHSLIRDLRMNDLCCTWDARTPNVAYGNCVIYRIPVENTEAIAEVMETYNACHDPVKLPKSYRTDLAFYMCEQFGEVVTGRKCISNWNINRGYLWLKVDLPEGVAVVSQRDAAIEQMFKVFDVALSVGYVYNDVPAPSFMSGVHTAPVYATVGNTAPKMPVGSYTDFGPFNMEADVPHGVANSNVLKAAYKKLSKMVDYPATYEWFCRGICDGLDVLDAMRMPNRDGKRPAMARIRESRAVSHDGKMYGSLGDLHTALFDEGSANVSRIQFAYNVRNGVPAAAAIYAR